MIGDGWNIVASERLACNIQIALSIFRVLFVKSLQKLCEVFCNIVLIRSHFHYSISKAEAST